jgi:hypothetical protein
MQAIQRLVMDSGMGGAADHPALLYTADGGVQQPDGSLPDLPAASVPERLPMRPRTFAPSVQVASSRWANTGPDGSTTGGAIMRPQTPNSW